MREWCDRDSSRLSAGRLIGMVIYWGYVSSGRGQVPTRGPAARWVNRRNEADLLGTYLANPLIALYESLTIRPEAADRRASPGAVSSNRTCELRKRVQKARSDFLSLR
jgi:hypothetical protein